MLETAVDLRKWSVEVLAVEMVQRKEYSWVEMLAFLTAHMWVWMFHAALSLVMRMAADLVCSLDLPMDFETGLKRESL